MEASARRPVMLSVVAILAIIQAVVSILAGIGLIIEHNNVDLRGQLDVSSGDITAFGVFLLIVGTIEIIVAIGLLNGNVAARYIVAILATLQVAGGVYQLIAYDGTGRWDGITQIIIGGLILYFLFNESAERFFTAQR